MAIFETFDFTENLGGRKILEFAHCVTKIFFSAKFRKNWGPSVVEFRYTLPLDHHDLKNVLKKKSAN